MGKQVASAGAARGRARNGLAAIGLLSAVAVLMTIDGCGGGESPRTSTVGAGRPAQAGGYEPVPTRPTYDAAAEAANREEERRIEAKIRRNEEERRDWERERAKKWADGFTNPYQ